MKNEKILCNRCMKRELPRWVKVKMHYGMYCGHCLGWIRWVKKEEVPTDVNIVERYRKNKPLL